MSLKQNLHNASSRAQVHRTSILLSRSLHSCTKQSLVPYRKYTACGKRKVLISTKWNCIFMSLQKNNKNNKNSYRIKRFLHSYLNPEPALFIQITDLVDDAAGEEGGRFLTVCMETERHQSVGPHREVVVHGQNLRRKSSVCFIIQLSASAGQALTCHERHRCSSISTERKNSPLVYESRRLLMLPGLSIWK